jgi:hypothetical protein
MKMHAGLPLRNPSPSARSSCLLAMALYLAAPAASAASLDSFKVDPRAISVSGLSGGAYMAQQFHVAYSSSIMGAGIIAGGPFYCAKGNVGTALTDCTTPTALNPPDVGYSLRVTDAFAGRAEIDAPGYMANARVWLFSGTLDTTVYPIVMQRLFEYYSHYVAPANLFFEHSIPAAHAMVTDNYGGACDHAGNNLDPNDVYINNCGYSAAGQLLKHIYGPLKARPAALTGSLVEFDQSEFIDNPPSHSMNPVGYAYIPADCDDGATCRVHAVFHGCLQYPARIGDKFYRHAGYNEWADTNRVIVLYPQAINSDLPPVYNPKGCWDWWGYDDANYARQSGRQMVAVKAMIDRLAAGYNPAPPGAPAGLTATVTSDNSVKLAWEKSRGPRLADYNVYYATAEGGPYARAGTTTQTQASIGGLVSGTTYWFRVKAESRRKVESPDSNTAGATTTGLPGVPSALAPIVAIVQ